MTDDITTALETVKEHLGNVDLSGYDSYERAEWYREGDAALSTIETELTRIETELTRWLEEVRQSHMTIDALVIHVHKIEAERDEAVAALREVEWLAQRAFRGKVSALTLLDVISRARLSTPKEPTDA